MTISAGDGFDLKWHAPSPAARRMRFAFASLFVCLIIIYGNSFHCAWQFDDFSNIVENPNIRLNVLTWDKIKESFYAPAQLGRHEISRPLAYFSFALNYYFGQYSVFGYHLVNFAIHYLASVFLFLFILNTLKLPSLQERYRQNAYAIALLSTFFWATHPIHVPAVTYIVQRMTSLAALFYVVSLYGYLKGRTSTGTSTRVACFALCTLSAACAFATKENAALLPFSILLYEILILTPVSRTGVKKLFFWTLPALVLFAGLAVFYLHLSSPFAEYHNRPYAPLERLMTEPRVILLYISQLFYPVSDRFSLIHDIAVSRSLLAPWTTLPAIAACLGFIALGAILAGRRPLIAFCILFFFLNHSLEASFLNLELIYEHRNYLPSMLIFVPVSLFVLKVLDYFSYRKALQIFIALSTAVLLAAQAHTVWLRNEIFHSQASLWLDNVDKTPHLTRPLNNLGKAYWDAGLYERAFEAFAGAAEINRDYSFNQLGVTYYNLGLYDLEIAGDSDEALLNFKKSLDIYPNYPLALSGVSRAYLKKGNFPEAEEYIRMALTVWPHDMDFLADLSLILLKRGKIAEANSCAAGVLQEQPSSSTALAVLGETHRREGKYRLSLLFWKRLLSVEPDNKRVHLAIIDVSAASKDENELPAAVLDFLRAANGGDPEALLRQASAHGNSKAYVPSSEHLLPIIHSTLGKLFSETSLNSAGEAAGGGPPCTE